VKAGRRAGSRSRAYLPGDNGGGDGDGGCGGVSKQAGRASRQVVVESCKYARSLDEAACTSAQWSVTNGLAKAMQLMTSWSSVTSLSSTVLI
jgi:hypothetical protein